MNPVQQLEQSLATINTPAIAQAFRAYGPRPTAAQLLMDAPATYNVTTPTATTTVTLAPSTLSSSTEIVIGVGLIIGAIILVSVMKG